MARIVISEFMDEGAVATLRAAHEVLYEPALVDDAARLVAQASRCEAFIVRNRTQVRGALLQALAVGGCRVVGRLGVGLDNLDLPGCEAAGIRVIPATGANARSVAEYVVTTALLLLRGAYADSAEVAAGAWPRARLQNGREAGGRVLGLLGFGGIGQLTARLARALDLRVIACDAQLPPDHAAWAELGVQAVGLDELLTQSDVLSLHVPLTEGPGGTRGLLDAARLARMKPGAILINTARGGIVDEVALAAALRAGHLGGAAIDVFASEPLPASAHLQGVPNLLLTPHIAGLSVEANDRVSSLIATRVLEALA